MKIGHFFVTCPYCGTRNQINPNNPDVKQYGMNVELCYPDNGGCDKYFAYKVDVRVVSESYKIEGES